MKVFSHMLFLSIMGIASGAFALGQVHVEKAAVGDRVLILTVDDSIRVPDLSKLQIDGYAVENAVFIEEMSPEPTLFVPNYLDMTFPDNGKIVDYLPNAGLLIVDLPSTQILQPGAILADTAFGGILRKVISVEGQPTSGLSGRRWVFKTEDAGIPEAVLNCDLAFRTRVDLNQVLADLNKEEDVIGELADGMPATGRMGFSLKSAQVLFQPVISGRIKIRNGQVELFQFKVSGDCEVLADISGKVYGQGIYEYEEELIGKRPMVVPLGSGLFLKVQQRPFFKMETRSRAESFSVDGRFRIKNSIKAELGFTEGQWKPLAENKMTFSDKSVRELWGEGEIKISLKPKVEVLLDGVQGPGFTFEPYARFASTSDDFAPRPMAPVLNGFSPVTGAMPGAFGSRKQMGLGSNIYMDMRANFVGPADMRTFLLFNYEQMVLSPPREGILVIREMDSSRIAFNCETYPKSDYYLIQQKLGNGPWETLLEKVVFPKIRLSSLKPSSPYRFRAIGINAMGMGPAFPPDGYAFNSPAANRPPMVPVPRFPDSAAIIQDSNLVLTWNGGDPDEGEKVFYTLLLDTHLPPLAVHTARTEDSSLAITGLPAGQTYYWRVVASDGKDRTEGPVRSFVRAMPVIVKPVLPKEVTADLPLVLVPKGSYRREDGKIVSVGPFFLGRNEVTQVEFQRITGKNPSYRFLDSLPVERVTWEEAQAYCQETGGRLPTEAEWEYAARAGSLATFYWGRESAGDYAWYRDNSENHTQKVGLKKPNAWGLHDMAGNVFEWVEDWYGEYSPTEVDHPRGPTAGTAKVIRGASWYSEAANLSMASRYSNRPSFRNFKVGFRCAKDVTSSASGHPKDGITSGLASQVPAQ